jgi:hypothetical protein
MQNPQIPPENLASKPISRGKRSEEKEKRRKELTGMGS